MFLSSLRHRRVKRRIALISAFAFLWSFVLATPTQLLASRRLSGRPAKVLGVRKLSEAEMARIVGQRHVTAVSAESGSTYPWEASVSGTNTGNGNKQTSIPISGWTARGGITRKRVPGRLHPRA